MKTTLKPRLRNDNVKLHDNPLLQRVLSARNIQSIDELQFQLKNLLHFNLLHGINQATNLLVDALRNDSRILIIGDFDADGATSCAVVIRALKLLGYKHVGYLVPNRFEYGYGLTPEIVELAAESKPDLIITVDNGISSIQGVESAKAKGWKVLITDHHLQGDSLPNADAIVNPNQTLCDFPSKCLAGVGVIFYVMLALRSKLIESRFFSNKDAPNLAQLLDLVALGTIADIVPLDANNRILVQQGLQRIRAGVSCVGIRALLDVAGKDYSHLSSIDIGFAVGPRLNAAGRLDDMSMGIECLLTDNYEKALSIAQELNQLNHERKAIQESMTLEAQNAVHKMQYQENTEMPSGLCLFEPSWHQGVVGLVASKVKDQVYRPVIAFAEESDTWLKGSARSIPGIHIRDALDLVAKKRPHLLNKFGGHAMAAGLSLEKRYFDEFKDVFNQVIEQLGSEYIGKRNLLSDGVLELEEFTVENAELLSLAMPFGQGFEPPLFEGKFTIKDVRILKGTHCKWILCPLQIENHISSAYSVNEQNAVNTNPINIEAILFNASSECLSLVAGDEVEIAYKLDINRFRNQSKLQLIVEVVTEIKLQ